MNHMVELTGLGSGKTSLIKSVVQLCEDIVHVDSLPTNVKSTSDRGYNGVRVVAASEIYASTKPYPRWWSDLDESRVLKRRKSVGDAVLERNLCFVDTCNARPPGKVAHYIEQEFIKSTGVLNQAGSDLASLLSGRGGTQVDVVLYLITKGKFFVSVTGQHG